MMNQRMRELLGQDADAPERLACSVPNDLLAELRDGFEEVSDCVVPRDPTADNRFGLDEGEDETGVECQISKVNFRDYVAKNDPFETMLRMGIGYVWALKQQLETSGVRGPFRVILGADPKGEYPSVTVRYHRRRPGQDWLGNDIEGYADGVMALDFGESREGRGQMR
jgi:hypothetical protein